MSTVGSYLVLVIALVSVQGLLMGDFHYSAKLKKKDSATHTWPGPSFALFLCAFTALRCGL